MLYVFGDSHTLIFKQFPHCKVHHLRNITMHRVGRDGIFSLIQKERLKTIKQQNDYILFSFGEIDCRNHVKRQELKGRNTIEVITTLVDNYIKTIKEIEYDKIIIMAVTPPPRCVDTKYFGFKEITVSVGTKEEILSYNQHLNGYLQEECQEHNIIFLDIRDKMVDKDGYLDDNKVDGTVHLDHKYAYLLEHKLKEVFYG